MRRRFRLIISLCGGIAIAAAFLVFVWLPFHQQLAVPLAGQGAALKKGELETVAGRGKGPAPEIPVQTAPATQWALPPFKEPEFKPFLEKEGENFAETFLERFYELVNLPISSPQSAPDLLSSFRSTSTKKEQSVANASAATSTEIILSLTDDEFHFLYPDAFIASLIESQNLFIKEYVPNYEPFSKIETDSQVRFIEEKLISALLLANMITKEQAERFIATIRFALPQLQIMELGNRKLSSSAKFNSVNMCFFPETQRLTSAILIGLTEKLFNLIIPEIQAGVCGYCYDMLPDCFQVGVPTPALGYNVFKAFCRCDGCYYGQGCLESCSELSPAIWDLMTGICGCG